MITCTSCKTKKINNSFYSNYYRKQVKTCLSITKKFLEYLKCDSKCCMCHRIKTHGISKNNKKQYKYINSIKQDIGKCQICNTSKHLEKYSYCYDFDHIEQDTKEHNISHMIGKNIKLIKEEIKKCRLLCGNCHMLRTQYQLHKYHLVNDLTDHEIKIYTEIFDHVVNFYKTNEQTKHNLLMINKEIFEILEENDLKYKYEPPTKTYTIEEQIIIKNIRNEYASGKTLKQMSEKYEYSQNMISFFCGLDFEYCGGISSNNSTRKNIEPKIIIDYTKNQTQEFRDKIKSIRTKRANGSSWDELMKKYEISNRQLQEYCGHTYAYIGEETTTNAGLKDNPNATPVNQQEIPDNIDINIYKLCVHKDHNKWVERKKFNKKSNAKDGLQPYCKDCINKIKRERNQKRQIIIPKGYKKKCTICVKHGKNKLYPASNFHKSKSMKDGLDNRCKNCKKLKLK